MGAARPPPPPFTLLPRGAGGAGGAGGVSTLHCPDPSLGPQAALHALSCRLPVAAIAAARTAGLQLALLARGPAGLVVTLVPAA